MTSDPTFTTTRIKRTLHDQLKAIAFRRRMHLTDLMQEALGAYVINDRLDQATKEANYAKAQAERGPLPPPPVREGAQGERPIDAIEALVKSVEP